jgi:hypothetical protein
MTTWEQRQHEKLVRAIRSWGWKMTRRERRDLVAEIEATGRLPVVHRFGRRWRRIYKYGRPAKIILICGDGPEVWADREGRCWLGYEPECYARPLATRTG